MAVTMTLWHRQSLAGAEQVPQTFSSWDNCMAKSYCKFVKSRFYVNKPYPTDTQQMASDYRHHYQASPFNSAPYQGYQPTPAPPMYNEPPQFARFDVSRKNPINEDALPAMPSWDNASSRKILEEQKEDEVEMERLDAERAQAAPMLANQAPSPHVGYSEIDSRQTEMPYQQRGAHYGGDLGNPYGHGGHSGPYEMGGASQSYNAQTPQDYRGHNDQQSYSAYTPSESTRYEPSYHTASQFGTGYASRSPPPRQQGARAAPNAFQVGRQATQNSWKDV
ncbi:hypothetical protein MMC20_000779 [Loxospora ochrophaea]|nr:hypothetical protein [Loxospora ochrophaea]